MPQSVEPDKEAEEKEEDVLVSLEMLDRNVLRNHSRNLSLSLSMILRADPENIVRKYLPS